MKKTFAPEIEDENAKLEQYRQVGAPGSAPASPRRTMIGVGVGALPGSSSGSGTGSRRSPAAEELNWDDEELDTQIFEKENTAEPELLEARDIFEDDEDRTVANEPPPDILRAATAPELATPQPRLPSRPGITPVGTPVDARSGPLGTQSGRFGVPLGAPRQSLLGLSAPSLPAPSVTGRTLPTASPAPGSLMRSSRLNMPVPPHLAPPPTQSFEVPVTGSARTSRMGLMVVVLLLVVGAVAGGGYYWSISRAGKVEISTVPADATILVDNVKVADKSPYTLDRPPGPYTVAVVRPGYVRNEQSVQVRSGQTMALSVTLEAAPDTGFELTSEPPGGLVWLDGNPMSGPDGQARTDFRAYRIPPGKHVLEIRGDAKYQPWRQEVDIEPGKILPVKATLVAVGGTEAKTPPGPAPAPAGGPVVAQLPTTSAPTPAAPFIGGAPSCVRAPMTTLRRRGRARGRPTATTPAAPAAAAPESATARSPWAPVRGPSCGSTARTPAGTRLTSARASRAASTS